MADITIAAVLRDGIFSPNHIGNDAAILHDTVAELRRKGFAVNIYTETQFVGSRIDEDMILAMCRGRQAVEKLQRLEDDGKIAVNSGYGIENCIRMFMTKILRDAGVPTPETIVVDTDVDVRRRLREAGFEASWVKIADNHLHHLEDTCRCRHVDEVQEILHEFFFRNIRKAAVAKETGGERMRFYGVASMDWFHCFKPYATGAAGDSGQDELAEKARQVCMKAAAALQVDVFGGDLSVTPQGECLLVNFDDWPSFAPIRREAARMIAKSVLARARKLKSRRKMK